MSLTDSKKGRYKKNHRDSNQREGSFNSVLSFLSTKKKKVSTTRKTDLSSSVSFYFIWHNLMSLLYFVITPCHGAIIFALLLYPDIQFIENRKFEVFNESTRKTIHFHWDSFWPYHIWSSGTLRLTLSHYDPFPRRYGRRVILVDPSKYFHATDLGLESLRLN